MKWYYPRYLDFMSSRCALLVDDDRDFSDMIRGLLSACGLDVVTTDWDDQLAITLRPALVFIAVDLPDKAGFAVCERVRAAAPRVPIVLATASVPGHEMAAHQKSGGRADAYFDKRTLKREELVLAIDALIGTDDGARVAELEEEVERLRWELDETRRAAQSAPFSKDFLRLSEVEASQAEARHLRLALERHAGEAARAGADLAEERRQHAETRGHHEAALAGAQAGHAAALQQAVDEQTAARSAIEAALGHEKERAVASL